MINMSEHNDIKNLEPETIEELSNGKGDDENE